MKKIRFKDYLIDYLDYNNISNKEFARRIGITEKHLIDILSGKRDISSWIIISISLVTDIPADYIYNVEANYKIECSIDEYLKEHNLTQTKFLNKFNYKYLIKNKYIEFTDTNDKMEISKDLLKFLRVSTPDKIYKIDTHAMYKSKNDKIELLLLWLEKCYRETLKQEIEEYEKENIDKLKEFIKEEAKKNRFSKERLIKKFNKNGIFLVIEDDIPGSKIRGAFKVLKNKPAIYLTKKHKRIADIYFALLHELAHCKSDFNKAKATSIISFTDKEEIEKNTDAKARNYMVDDRYYSETCLNKNYDITKENKYPKSFIVYRMAADGKIRYNSKIYQKYNPVILEL